MPSDARTTAALAALAGPRDRYRSALAATLEEVRVWLDTHRAAATDRVAQFGAELGPLGARHLDVRKLAGVLAAEPLTEPTAHVVIARAFDVLQALVAAGDEAYLLDLAPGDNLYHAVDARLAQFGRAMGAARVVDLARSGRYRPSDHDRWLDAFPFGHWNQVERDLAPPIVVEVNGADLRAAGLAEFLDGGVKFVLVARGEAGPAPLVRLVTPRTFVAQAADGALVARLAAWNGPGVVGIMPDGAARFVHDPAVAGGLAARLSVTEIPSLDRKRRAGPFTVAQQQEDLEQLEALQSTASAASGSSAVPGVPPTDPVDKLAAWLLQQADLAGV